MEPGHIKKKIYIFIREYERSTYGLKKIREKALLNKGPLMNLSGMIWKHRFFSCFSNTQFKHLRLSQIVKKFNSGSGEATNGQF